jgi:hypothetical protein
MKRRDFLTTTAAAGAAALTPGTGPLLLGVENKAGGRNPVIGQGEYRYECHHNWGQRPAGIPWQTTHGVCVDAAGLVYVTHMGFAGQGPLDVVLVFDPEGKFVRSFGKQFYGGGHGIDVRREGGEEFLYLCHMHPVRSVAKTTLKGEVVWTKSFPAEAKVYKDVNGFSPTNVAFAPDGGFYVADGYGSNFIHQYDKDARWVRTFSGTGVDVGKTQTPHGLWLDDRRPGRPELVVADRANARLQYFSPDGTFLRFVHDVLFPAHFDVRGDLLLVPDLHARVSLFDRDNAPVAHLGDDLAWRKRVLDGFKVRADERQWRPGKFVHPHDACFDRDGNIFVAEWVQTGRVSLLKKV